MEYDSFKAAIMALMAAKDDQAEFHHKRVPVEILEHANEQVARIRGQAIGLAGEADERPSFDSLCRGAVKGMKLVLAGEGEKGNTLIRMSHVVRDVLYPGQVLKTPESQDLMRQIRERREQ